MVLQYIQCTNTMIQNLTFWWSRQITLSPISSLVVKIFKYKICYTCLPYVDLIYTHVLHLVYLWTPVHLMNHHVIRISYVQTNNKTSFILWKESMNILINKEINQFISSILIDWDHKTNRFHLESPQTSTLCW